MKLDSFDSSNYKKGAVDTIADDRSVSFESSKSIGTNV
jgi:hypothetical protein